ncbi:MAG TPA: GNAT family N-acetyltransferase [Burkholderiales bacterium]|nr:GNAT family N-acetyltransferase [Burkholderiales bacterium]
MPRRERKRRQADPDHGGSSHGPEDLLFRVDGIEVVEANPDDAAGLQALLEESSDFFELTTGLPPGSAEVQSLFTAVPGGKTYADKHVIALLPQSEGTVGVMDAVSNYPENDSWWLALLLLGPRARRRGIGTLVFNAFVDWAAAHGARNVYLSVKAQNEAAIRFWRRLGFISVETKASARLGANDSIVIVMRQQLILGER